MVHLSNLGRQNLKIKVKKWSGDADQWQSACLGCRRPQAQSQYHQEREERKEGRRREGGRKEPHTCTCGMQVINGVGLNTSHVITSILSEWICPVDFFLGPYLVNILLSCFVAVVLIWVYCCCSFVEIYSHCVSGWPGTSLQARLVLYSQRCARL